MHPSAQQQWLAQVSEPVLEPALPICDPHHHLWDHPGSRYLLDELLADIGNNAAAGQEIGVGHNVVSTVFVECGSMYRANGASSLRPVGETEFVQGIAAMSASGRYGPTRVASGIVGYADLTLGRHVKAVLEAHVAASPKRFCGIRHATAWHAAPEIRNAHTNPTAHLMLDETFRQGFAELEAMGLNFDAWFFHHQLDEFTDLARTFPGVTIILDHFGGPLGIGPYAGQQDAVFGAWKDSISALADCPNVHLKLGGINMKINGYAWHKRAKPPSSNELVEATGPYYEHCLQLFGANRCMFESNFPVDRDSCAYTILWNAFKKLSQGLDKNEKAALFHDTATRVYGL